MWQIPHFWLLVLVYGEEYAKAGFPTLSRLFSKRQIGRITCMWLLATAASGIAFPTFTPEALGLPWNLALVAASVWLGYHAIALVLGQGRTAEDRPYLRSFMRVNLYALIIVLCLLLSALGIVLP